MSDLLEMPVEYAINNSALNNNFSQKEQNEDLDELCLWLHSIYESKVVTSN